MSQRIRPVVGKILLRMQEEQEQTINGIVIQKGQSRGGFREAFVQALPDGYLGDLEAGDRVVVPPYAGTEVRIDGALLVFVKPDKIEAALE